METKINPYESPAYVAEARVLPVDRQRSVAIAFRPASLSTALVTILLGSQIVFNVLLAAAFGSWCMTLDSAITSGSLAPQQVEEHTALQTPLWILCVVTQISASIAFLFWVYYVHRNLRALQNESLEFTSGWAVGWFFVPIMHLYKPFQAVREIWRCSDPETIGEGKPVWFQIRVPLVRWWWGFHLTSLFAGYILQAFTGKLDTLETIRQAALVTMFGILLLDIPYAGIKLNLVRKIYAMQYARFYRLSSRESPLPAEVDAIPTSS